MIRTAIPSDLPQIRALWEICFPEEDGFNAYFFAHHFALNTVLLYAEKEEVCAMVQQIPYILQDGAAQKSVTYIYGACTAPQHRRKGMMRALLEESVQRDLACGYMASILIPQDEWLFDFYAPFGYQAAFYLTRRQFTESEGGILPVQLNETDLVQMQKLYKDCSENHILRTRVQWQEQLQLFQTLGSGVWGWKQQNNLTAYAFCWGHTVQEAVGMTDAQGVGLCHALCAREITVFGPGHEKRFGCIRWHQPHASYEGYMNLMFN